MAEPILMPRLTIDMEKGTVLEWFKEEGDAVARGEVVAKVFGDKVEWEVEAPADGVLLKVLVEPDGETAVAAPIGWVGRAGEAVPADAPPAAPESPAPAPPVPPPADVETAPAPGRHKASPAAKRLAKEMGVDLAGVKGSGPGGRIVEADVVAAAGPAEAAGPVALSPLRRTIAERMLKSWRAVPHFTLETEVDMEAAARFREAHPGPGGKPFTWNDLVVAAAGRALDAFEGLRRRWEGETLVAVPGTALGVAVHTDEGLVVPVVRDAGRKTLGVLAAEIREKAARARTARLAPEDLHPAAMTVTNLGMFGVTRFVPVVNHPECSILAVGKVEDRIRAREAWFGVRPVMTLNLALDHRALDGGLGARFLARVKAILEEADFRL